MIFWVFFSIFWKVTTFFEKQKNFIVYFLLFLGISEKIEKKVKKIIFFRKMEKCLFFHTFEFVWKFPEKVSFFLKNSLATDFLSDFFLSFSIFLQLFFLEFFWKFTNLFENFRKKVKKRLKKIKNTFFQKPEKCHFFPHIFSLFFENFCKNSTKSIFFWKIHWRPIFWVTFFKTFYSSYVLTRLFDMFPIDIMVIPLDVVFLMIWDPQMIPQNPYTLLCIINL